MWAAVRGALQSRWAARAAPRHAVPYLSPVYPEVAAGRPNVWPKVGWDDRASWGQATGLPHARPPNAPASVALAGTTPRHAALRNTNGRLSPGLGRGIMVCVHGLRAAGLSGSGGHLGWVDHELCLQRGERANDTP